MLYNTTVNGVAEYLSDTEFTILPIFEESTVGFRTTGAPGGYPYEISARNVACGEILVKNDCFMEENGDVTVISYIPTVQCTLKTNEFSKYYKRDESLAFKFKVPSTTVRNKISADLAIHNYDDVKKQIDFILQDICMKLQELLNSYEGCCWNISGVECSYKWQVDLKKSRQIQGGTD